MAVDLATLEKSALFPLAEVTESLRGELLETVKSEASIRGIALPEDPTAIANCSFQIDSLVVVSILCAVEPLVGFELPESVVRTGGYRSVDGALEHLLPRIVEHWTKRIEVKA